MSCGSILLQDALRSGSTSLTTALEQYRVDAERRQKLLHTILGTLLNMTGRVSWPSRQFRFVRSVGQAVSLKGGPVVGVLPLGAAPYQLSSISERPSRGLGKGCDNFL